MFCSLKCCANHAQLTLIEVRFWMKETIWSAGSLHCARIMKSSVYNYACKTKRSKLHVMMYLPLIFYQTRLCVRRAHMRKLLTIRCWSMTSHAMTPCPLSWMLVHARPVSTTRAPRVHARTVMSDTVMNSSYTGTRNTWILCLHSVWCV